MIPKSSVRRVDLHYAMTNDGTGATGEFPGRLINPDLSNG